MAFTNQAYSQNGKMSAIDLLVDYKSLIGTIVEVGDCTVVYANSQSADCIVGTALATPGSIALDAPTMDRESLRHALGNCAGFIFKKQCLAVTIRGVVKANPFLPSPMLEGAEIEWDR
jgi:hypothetical protein